MLRSPEIEKGDHVSDWRGRLPARRMRLCVGRAGASDAGAGRVLRRWPVLWGCSGAEHLPAAGAGLNRVVLVGSDHNICRNSCGEVVAGRGEFVLGELADDRRQGQGFVDLVGT